MIILKLSSNKETLAESKIILLYLLNKIQKPVTNDVLLKLVTNITDINYFYFQQFLLDLIDSRYVASYVKEGDKETIYEITREGKEILELTQDIIPGIIKLKIDSNFKKELETVEEEFSISSEFIPTDETHFTVTCKVNENSNSIFEVKIFAGSRDTAKAICDNWNHRAIDIYPKIIELLTHEY